MLPREDLLAGAQEPKGLTVLIDLAEQVLRTWQPAWSPFLSAPLREETLARLGSLSELTWMSDGGYPGAERQLLLCHRRDDTPDSAAPVQGLLIEGNFLFDPLSPDDLREALQAMGIDETALVISGCGAIAAGKGSAPLRLRKPFMDAWVPSATWRSAVNRVPWNSYSLPYNAASAPCKPWRRPVA